MRVMALKSQKCHIMSPTVKVYGHRIDKKPTSVKSRTEIYVHKKFSTLVALRSPFSAAAKLLLVLVFFLINFLFSTTRYYRLSWLAGSSLLKIANLLHCIFQREGKCRYFRRLITALRPMSHLRLHRAILTRKFIERQNRRMQCCNNLHRQT